jgi:hypothetical protein
MKRFEKNRLSGISRGLRNFVPAALAFIRAYLLIAAVAVIVAVAEPSSAADLALPPVNLGETSFQDGIAFPGWLVEETFIYYHANSFTDSKGDDIPGSNRLTAISAVTHVAWISNFRLLGGVYGAEVLMPIAVLDGNTDFGPDGRERGVGDLIVGPFFIQWTDSKLFGMPYFHRFNLDFVLPTGEYSQNSSVNVGSNIYTFNPYYAFTLFPTDRLEVSARLHYLWCSENSDPFVGLGANDTQPGQAVHANFAASYEILKDLRLGLNGYYLQQITDDKLDGDDQAKSKERVLGIGPGLKYTYERLSLYLNTYYETVAENRPEGFRGIFRLSMVF